jgi:hypothetical protein
LVTSLLTNPGNRKQHFVRSGASTIMAILYDYPTTTSAHDKDIDDMERSIYWSKRISVAGTFLVEFFPWMLHIPQRLGILYYF